MIKTIDLMTGNEWTNPDQLHPLARNEMQERTAGVLAVAALCLGTFGFGVPAVRPESSTRLRIEYGDDGHIPQPRAPIPFISRSSPRVTHTR